MRIASRYHGNNLFPPRYSSVVPSLAFFWRKACAVAVLFIPPPSPPPHSPFLFEKGVFKEISLSLGDEIRMGSWHYANMGLVLTLSRFGRRCIHCIEMGGEFIQFIVDDDDAFEV
ncbi:hypothetical protein CDAR_435641 [Caerostris darwini]|uniref:Uncharacterized protein n=1 Tax=Caerostris darwini TaxID=1538125 RepID=A0AAV4P9I2_9ARAC|nr:hypothetical protein CDAR_435641 [Caerostris darwini]